MLYYYYGEQRREDKGMLQQYNSAGLCYNYLIKDHNSTVEPYFRRDFTLHFRRMDNLISHTAISEVAVFN